MNVTPYSDNVFDRDTTITHIGQLFYPESLRSTGEEVSPYNTTTQDIASNDDDIYRALFKLRITMSISHMFKSLVINLLTDFLMSWNW